jgi:hypothetical protein
MNNEHRDKDNNLINTEAYNTSLKEDILSKGFTITEDERTIQIDDSGQFFWKLRHKYFEGIADMKMHEFTLTDKEGKVLHCQYPRKTNIMQHDENSFTKRVRGCVIKYEVQEQKEVNSD